MSEGSRVEVRAGLEAWPDHGATLFCCRKRPTSLATSCRRRVCAIDRANIQSGISGASSASCRPVLTAPTIGAAGQICDPARLSRRCAGATAGASSSNSPTSPPTRGGVRTPRRSRDRAGGGPPGERFHVASFQRCGRGSVLIRAGFSKVGTEYGTVFPLSPELALIPCRSPPRYANMPWEIVRAALLRPNVWAARRHVRGLIWWPALSRR
jgi:hypothetical protein